SLGKRLGDELRLPVYLYGEAATRPERRDLPNVRKGQYEGLRVDVERDPERAPDFGPAALGPAGATAVGAREPLIAFNVNLRTSEVGIAKAIARTIRESGGGLPALRAIGLAVAGAGEVQVSMNLTDFRRTGLLAAFGAVREEANRLGVEVAGSQIVGLVPAAALGEVVAQALQSPSFDVNQIVERAIIGGEETSE
ncbi:MAG: glutamate formimidoyltransferase, partial [Chloroflexota bacterium]